MTLYLSFHCLKLANHEDFTDYEPYPPDQIAIKWSGALDAGPQKKCLSLHRDPMKASNTAGNTTFNQSAAQTHVHAILIANFHAPKMVIPLNSHVFHRHHSSLGIRPPILPNLIDTSPAILTSATSAIVYLPRPPLPNMAFSLSDQLSWNDVPLHNRICAPPRYSVNVGDM